MSGDILPLVHILHESVVLPMGFHVQFVNKTVVDYFFRDLKLKSHFEALRRYFLMYSGTILMLFLLLILMLLLSLFCH